MKLLLLNSEISELFNKSLLGGFSISASNYAFFTGFNVKDNLENNEQRQCIYSDANSLYPTILSTFHSTSYTLCTPTRQVTEFEIVSQALKNGDIDFFYHQAFENKIIFYCEVELSFHDEAVLSFLNVDFSSLPFKHCATFNQLTKEQYHWAKAAKRNPQKENPKLMSFLKKKNIVATWAECILYQTCIHDLKITNVFKIVKCNSARIFNKWITRLQNQKNFNPSPLLLRVIKNLSNSLPGEEDQQTDGPTDRQTDRLAEIHEL